MKHPWLFALPFASLCPFNAFVFPSVSPFWSASNPDWLNELRSDYPLANWHTTIRVRSELFVGQDCCSAFRRTWVSCPLEPLSSQPASLSPSCPQFLVIHGDLVRGVVDQYHKPCAQGADRPCRCNVDLRALSCELRRNRKEPEHVSKPRSNKV